MIVLTDGQWDTPPPLSSVAGSITANTYAIGLGLPSNLSVPALTTLCQGHNGFLLITGQLSPDQSMRLSKYFLQILAGVTNAQIAADPRGVLDTTAEHRIPFWICEADYGMDLIVLSPFPQIIDFQLEAPDGTRITPASGPAGANSQFVLSRYASYYRCALPVLPANATGSHEGLWYAILKLGHVPGTPTYQRLKEANPGYYDPKRAVLPYELVAQTFSSLTFERFVSQNSYDIGAVVTFSAMLLEYSRPLSSGAQVWAEIERPDKTLDFVSLTASGDQFTGSYELRWSGVYALRLRARGQTMRGTRFERNARSRRQPFAAATTGVPTIHRFTRSASCSTACVSMACSAGTHPQAARQRGRSRRAAEVPRQDLPIDGQRSRAPTAQRRTRCERRGRA